jgi:uncharacterized surface anchored protein
MKSKKIATAVLAGVLAVTSVIAGTSAFNASTTSTAKNVKLYRFFEAGDDKDEDMYSKGYWAKQGVTYTPVWKSADGYYVEPNYFRTEDGEVAYCVDPLKETPSKVTADGSKLSVEAYRVVKNGYPAKSGSDYGVSDVELEWATTVALKGVVGNGDSYEASDFGTEMLPIGDEANAEKIENVVLKLMDSAKGSDEIDKFDLSADDVEITLNDGTYKVGPYKLDTNLSGKTTYQLEGAPASARIAKEDDGYYVLIDEADVTVESKFTITFTNADKMLAADTYKPASEDEQLMYIYKTVDAVATAEVTVGPLKVVVDDNTQKGIITINKQNESGDAIEGVEFEIYNEAGKKVETITTDKNGKASSSKLALGSYTVKESKAADGYILSQEEIKFTLSEDKKNEVAEVSKTLINKKNSVTITKVISGTTTGLQGAELAIVDANGTTVASGTTDKDGKLTVKCIPAGTYTVKETKAPAGYKLTTDTITFTIDEYGKVTGDTELANTAIVVEIKKVDSDTNKGLEGATIEIKDENNKTVYVGKTNSKGILTVEKLSAGKYTATETAAPSGYKLNETAISFTVDENGKVTGTTTIKNEATKVTITKKDSADNTLLAGAKISVKDSDGNEVASGTTDENGVFEITGLAPGTYIYTETSAPEGYVKTNEKATFTINSKGEDVELTLYNTKLSTTSSTTDSTTESATTTTSTSETTATASTTSATGETIKTGVEESSFNIIPVIILVFAVAGAAGYLVYRKKSSEQK